MNKIKPLNKEDIITEELACMYSSLTKEEKEEVDGYSIKHIRLTVESLRPHICRNWNDEGKHCMLKGLNCECYNCSMLNKAFESVLK